MPLQSLAALCLQTDSYGDSLYTPDLFTSRLRLAAVTSEHLIVETAEPQKLGSLLGARVPQEWPSKDWDANVFAIIQRQYAEHPNTSGWHRYVILSGEEQILIGALGAFPKVGNEAEIGYGILPNWQRHGYAPEGASALIQLLFEQGVHSVIAHTFRHMQESIRVMEKCGLAYEAPGEEEDTVRYRLRRKQVVD